MLMDFTERVEFPPIILLKYTEILIKRSAKNAEENI